MEQMMKIKEEDPSVSNSIQKAPDLNNADYKENRSSPELQIKDSKKDSMLSKYKSGANDDQSDYNGRLETPLILKSHKTKKENDEPGHKMRQSVVRQSDPLTRFFDPEELSS
jgi:hypothetical protein